MAEMNKSSGRHGYLPIIMWILTMLWFGIVFFLSSQTGEETRSLSQRLAVFLGNFFNVSEADLPVFHSNLRTAAHIIVYFILSMLAYASSRLSFPKTRFSWVYVVGTCSLFAVLDEVRKAYIPGRHCSYPEAGLNILGVVAGVLSVALVFRIRHLRRSQTK